MRSGHGSEPGSPFPDKRYLVISTDPAHSLADSFGESALPSNLEMRESDSNESLQKVQRGALRATAPMFKRDLSR